jgi:hypothetical protein
MKNSNTIPGNTLANMTVEEIFLDWINNFRTVERMAEYYNVPQAEFEPMLRAIVKLRRTIYG